LTSEGSIYLFIYLTTILLQAVASLVQSCRGTWSFENTTTQEELKTKTEMQKRIHCIASISYSTSGTHQQYWIQHLKRGRRIRYVI